MEMERWKSSWASMIPSSPIAVKAACWFISRRTRREFPGAGSPYTTCSRTTTVRKSSSLALGRWQSSVTGGWSQPTFISGNVPASTSSATLHVRHRGGESRHAENDPGTLPWLADNLHLAAMKQHDALHDRQTEAGAARGL